MICSNPDFPVRILTSDRLAIVRFIAEPDGKRLRRMSEFIATHAVRPLVLVDLAQVSCPSAPLMSALVQIHDRLKEKGAQLAVCGVGCGQPDFTAELDRHKITVMRGGVDQHAVHWLRTHARQPGCQSATPQASSVSRFIAS
jgi:anti-anti-sigma regulatory factor